MLSTDFIHSYQRVTVKFGKRARNCAISNQKYTYIYILIYIHSYITYLFPQRGHGKFATLRHATPPGPPPKGMFFFLGMDCLISYLTYNLSIQGQYNIACGKLFLKSFLGKSRLFPKNFFVQVGRYLPTYIYWDMFVGDFQRTN